MLQKIKKLKKTVKEVSHITRKVVEYKLSALVSNNSNDEVVLSLVQDTVASILEYSFSLVNWEPRLYADTNHEYIVRRVMPEPAKGGGWTVMVELVPHQHSAEIERISIAEFLIAFQPTSSLDMVFYLDS